MMLMRNGSTRSFVIGVLTAATLVGCSSSSDGTTQHGEAGGLSLPQRETTATPPASTQAEPGAPQGAQHVSTIAPPPPAPECKAADDCTGPLPDLACYACWDGSDTCPRHECKGGACEIVIPKCPAQCASDADCRAFSDTCGGCSCKALGAKQAPPKCGAAEVACFADPCGGKFAACDVANGLCVLK